MAFPTIPTVAAGRVLWALATNPSGTHTSPDLSSLTKNAGDLLIAGVIIYDGNSTNAEFSAWGGGFTEFADFAGTGTMGIGLAYKWSTGSETGTFTVTSADASTNDSAFFLLSIAGAHASTPPEAGGFVTGTTTAPNPSDITPSWGSEETLWVGVVGVGETATGGSFTGVDDVSAIFTDYSDSGISADVVGGVEGAVEFLQDTTVPNSAGAATLDLSNARNCALTFVVRPAAVVAAAAAFVARRRSAFSVATGPGEYHARPRYRYRTTRTFAGTVAEVAGPIIRSWAEAASTSDAWARVATLARSVTEAPTTSDAWARVLTLPRTLTEAISTSDTWARLVTVVRTWTSAPTTSDAWTRTGTFLRATSEAISTSDSWSRVGTFLRTWSEAVSTSDAWVGFKVILRTFTEAITTSDAWTRTGTYLRATSESISTSDTWARLGTFIRTWAEAISTSDAWVATKLGAIIRTWTESVSTSDAWTRSGTFIRTLTEAVSTSDSWTALKVVIRTWTTSLTTSDSWARSLTAVRSLTTTLTTSDAWTRTATLARSFTSALTTSDAWARFISALTSGLKGPVGIASNPKSTGIATTTESTGVAVDPDSDGIGSS